ncbi:hypothetical protein MMC31_005120 [Peltigera leucophlebia]|nr:hypothetical protein [Peltigera leucophlebia]
MSSDTNPVKLQLVDVNTILTLTSIQGTLDPNQIILQGKIRNRLGESLEVRCLADTGASVTYISSHLLPHLPPARVKDIESKEIEFGNGTTGESKQKVDLSLQIGSYKERFRAYAMNIPEYDVVLGIDWHRQNQLVIN